MAILGIDYGRRKLGLALATAKIAEPLKVLRYKFVKDALKEIRKVVEAEGVERVVVGVSEGPIALESKNFGKLIKEDLKIPVKFVDETLSTQEAQFRSISSGMRLTKRKELEDAFAAAVILQSYLDLSPDKSD